MARPYPKFTYEDYLLLPEDKRYELIGGDLMMVPAPNVQHQRVIGNLFVALRGHVQERRLGEVFVAPCDVVLSRYDVVQPDLIFVSKERRRIITEQNIQGAPDLVIEILSPDQDRDKVIKRKLYAKYRIKEYWLVDPEAETIEVLDLKEKGYEEVVTFSGDQVVASSILAGLRLRPADIFKRPQ